MLDLTLAVAHIVDPRFTLADKLDSMLLLARTCLSRFHLLAYLMLRVIPERSKPLSNERSWLSHKYSWTQSGARLEMHVEVMSNSPHQRKAVPSLSLSLSLCLSLSLSPLLSRALSFSFAFSSFFSLGARAITFTLLMLHAEETSTPSLALPGPRQGV